MVRHLTQSLPTLFRFGLFYHRFLQLARAGGKEKRMAIRALREAAGMRQYELAARMGVAQASVCAWEKGESYPSVENLLKLAEIFACSTDEVLGRKTFSA